MNAVIRQRSLRIGYHVALVALALRLWAPAVALLLVPGAVQAFDASGLPDWVRPALAWPEIGGAVLFVLPATFWWGAGLLALDLAGALAAHVYLRHFPWSIVIFLAVLGLLAALRRRILAPQAP